MANTGTPLARILATILNAQEQEGVRAARLLHDEVGQILSAAGLQLDVLRMDTESESPELARRIIEIQKILEQAIDHVRTLSYELSPAIVERAGLQAALNRLVGRYRDTSDSSIRHNFDSSVRLPMKAATCFYKIAECALDNAVKHSGGRRLEVSVHPARNGVALEVRDDGDGFAVEEVRANPTGLGLLLMECYAEQGNLKLGIESTRGRGTIVKGFYPLAEETPEAVTDAV